MGDFIGVLGGILMIVLIVVLLWRFLLDVGVVKDKSYAKSIGVYAIAAAGIGILQVLLGALIFNFNSGPVSAFDFVNIWNFEPISGILLDSSAYSADKLGSSGLFPLYPIIVSFFSKILFDMYTECAFYISFLSGVVFYTCMGKFFKSKYEEENGNKILAMLFCFPGAFIFFLPCSLSLFMALFAALLLALESKHLISATILVVLCCLTHICGIAALALLAYRLVAGEQYKSANSTKMFVITCVQLVLLGLCIRFGWCGGAERWLLFAIPAVTLVGQTRIIKSVEFYRLILVMEVLFCGFYMTGKVYCLF